MPPLRQARVLLIHNRYQQSGGEDSVFKSENDLLLARGHVVDHLLYDNSGIKTFFDKCVSGLLTIYNPASARQLRAKIRSFHPDVIHVHNFLPLASPSIFFVAKKMKVPIVLTLHNYRLLCPSATLFFRGKIYERSIYSFFPFDAIWKGVYRNSVIQTFAVAAMTAVHRVLGTWNHRISYYIALTRFAKEKFKNSAISISDSRLFVKPNFVEDCGKGLTTRDDFFLFVGRLTEEKGINTLLQAAGLKNFRIVIIGDGPMKKTVQQAAENNDRISFLGQQPKPVVMQYLKKCKALIFPSIWYEGFPVTILEAFSTCTPVIASSLGGMNEIVQDRDNGLLFKGGDEEDLVVKITEIIQGADLAKRLSENARLTYLEKYTPVRNYEYLLQVYGLAMGQLQA